jgi:hypothetical protein
MVESCSPDLVLIPTELIEQVNAKVSAHQVGRLFAVVHAAGLQRKVTTEDLLLLDKLISADVGDRIVLNKVSDHFIYCCFIINYFLFRFCWLAAKISPLSVALF